MPIPSGIVTFLFTDIEGSTKLWERHPDAMRVALARHDALLRQAIEGNGGYVFKTVGDAFCAAFASGLDALQAALDAHLALLNHDWAETGPLRIRAGLHTGRAEERDDDYFGETVNRVARLLAIGHGQQTLLSQVAYQLVNHSLPADVTIQDMGQQRLKDLLAPEHVWQLLHPSLPAVFPPLKSLDYLPTNLPRQMTSFIGRETEMQEVKRLLPSTPLLTVLGTGGSGKTRIALQVGADLLDHYADGVWLVELAAVSSPDLVPQTIATALGLREESGRPLLQTVQDHLRDRQLLLILDNCEHLIVACAAAADTLLKICPRLTILATSREPLGVVGERPWRVPSLLTPVSDDLVHEKAAVTALMQYDACRLFVERATVQRQDFVLTRSNAPAVAQLCRQLDGIPLAIELAAARVRSLSVEEINNKLDNCFRLLTGGSRTALPRQQTLRALIDWSYDLLNPQEKTLLNRLSVFAGGWTLEAAEAVCTGEALEDWEVLDLLTSLVDKSLVVTEQTQDQTRYRLLTTVRQYARDRLVESGNGKSTRDRHQAFFLTLVETAHPELLKSDGAFWIQRLETEHENFRVALEWENRAVALQIAGILVRFWEIRGYHSEGRQWLAKTLAGAPEGVSVIARAHALNAAGLLARAQGDIDAAQVFFQQSLTQYELSGNKRGSATTIMNLGFVAYQQGNYTTARVFFERSLALYRELENKHGVAMCLLNMGTMAFEQSDNAAAFTLYMQCLAMVQEVGDKRTTAMALMNLGNVAANQTDYLAAQAYYQQSLALLQELGDKPGAALTLLNLSDVVGRQGDYTAAHTLLRQSLTHFQETGDKRHIAYAVQTFADLACRQEYAERAAVLWGAADALRETLGTPLPPSDRIHYDEDVARMRSASGDNAFDLAWRKGRAMTMEQAIEYAMDAGFT